MTKIRIFTCLLGALPALPARWAAAQTPTTLTIATADAWAPVAPVPVAMGGDEEAYARNFAFPPLLAINDQWRWECVLCEAVPDPQLPPPPPATPPTSSAQAIEAKQKRFKGMRATWRIRDGWAWSDGVPVTGHDVAFTVAFLRAAAPDEKARGLFPITGVEVDPASPRTFTLLYRTPRFDWRELSAIVLLPSHKFLGKPTDPLPADIQARALALYQSPTGAPSYGPYQVVEATGSHVKLKRNPHFTVGGAAPFETVEIQRFGGFKEMLDAARKGQAHVTADVWQHPADAMAAGMEQAGNARRVQGPAVAVEQLTLNLRNPMLSDAMVRKALTMAVNRKALAKAVAGSEDLATDFPTGTDDPFLPKGTNPIPYDPKQAGALLDGAGWRLNADGVREKNGQRMDVIISTTHDNARMETYQQLKKAWVAIGIPTEVETTPTAEFVHDVLAKARFRDTALHSWIHPSPSAYWAAWHSTQIPIHLNGYRGQNIGAWFEKAVDKQLDDMEKTVVVADLAPLVGSVLKFFHEQQPAIPLYVKPSFLWVDKSVAGVRAAGRGFTSSAFSYQWKAAPASPRG